MFGFLNNLLPSSTNSTEEPVQESEQQQQLRRQQQLQLEQQIQQDQQRQRQQRQQQQQQRDLNERASHIQQKRSEMRVRRDSLLLQATQQLEIRESGIHDLHRAVEGGNRTAVERLLKNHSNPNNVRGGISPMAIVKDRIFSTIDSQKCYQYLRILCLLVEHGGNLDGFTEKEFNTVYQVCSFGLQMILSKKRQPTLDENNEQQRCSTKMMGKAKPEKYAKDVFDGCGFNIQYLQKIRREDKESYLQGEEDFIVLLEGDQWDGRTSIGVKLGSLYIEYRPGGKESFEACVFEIDPRTHQVNPEPLYDFSGARYEGISFGGIMIFDLSSFYGCMTCAGRSSSYDYCSALTAYAAGYEIKKILTQKALRLDRAPAHDEENEEDQISSLQSSVIKLKKSQNELDVEEDPDEFYCPITSELMKDAVTTAYGQTYDRAAILSWIATCEAEGRPVTDPTTRQLLEDRSLYPNYNLQDRIDDFMVSNLEQAGEEAADFMAQGIRRRNRPEGSTMQQLLKAAPSTKISIYRELREAHEKTRNKKECADKDKGKEKESEQDPKKTSAVESTERTIPEAFICPLTRQPMEDPVILAPHGHSYERESLNQWLEMYGTDPLTNEPVLELPKIISNYALKNLIERYVEKQAALEAKDGLRM